MKQRSDFSLENNDVVYLSSQSIFKYLPEYDRIFPAIATKVNNAKFVFIELYKSLTEKFKHRLEKVFAEYDLNVDNYCLFLPRLREDDYLQLNFVTDVFLDTFGWSGDNTTRTAIACSLPVVTCPGEFMRGRHSFGMLKMIGVEDTIAQNRQEYLDIAVGLGLDRNWRQSIIEKIKANSDRLYNDLTCVKALEKFYQQIVANYPSRSK
jgi:predicted O-linked N-acetylglucosamine transferase (SPINDLY family)